MQYIRPTGRNASSQKYDILTALGASALKGTQHDQKRSLRFMLLITARYNWQRDVLCVGQREIAAMWSCDERTVKREMGRFKALGWLVVLRQGARGRVTEYRLDFPRLLHSTQSAWDGVGPDFSARMRSEGDSAASTSTVVPLPVKGRAPAPAPNGTTEWDITRLQLHAEDEGLYAAWIHALVRDSRAGGHLVLKAPSRFHASYVSTHLLRRIETACCAVDETIDHISITH